MKYLVFASTVALTSLSASLAHAAAAPSVASKTYELFGSVKAVSQDSKFKCITGNTFFVAPLTDKIYQGGNAGMVMAFGPATTSTSDFESGSLTVTDQIITTINAPSVVNNQVLGTWVQKKNASGDLTSKVEIAFSDSTVYVDSFVKDVVEEALDKFSFAATVGSTNFTIVQSDATISQTKTGDNTFTEKLQLVQKYDASGQIVECFNNVLAAKITREMSGEIQGQYPIAAANPAPAKKFNKYMTPEKVFSGGPKFAQTVTFAEDTNLAEVELFLKPRVCIGTKKATGLRKEGLVANVSIYDKNGLEVQKSEDLTIFPTSKKQDVAFSFINAPQFLFLKDETYTMELVLSNAICGTAKGSPVQPEIDWYRTKMVANDPDAITDTYSGGTALLNGTPIDLVDFAFNIKKQ